MGLIKSAIEFAGNILDNAKGSFISVLGDQYLEFITCPEVEKDVIVQRGEIHYGKSNTTHSDGVITDGSGIVIPQGMAMMLVDNGEIKEFCSIPGTYTYNASSEPSIFADNKEEEGIIKKSISTFGQRFAYGQMAPKDQRVYYVNIKTIPGFPFGSEKPRLINDPIYESVEVQYNGEYSIKISDPVLLINEIIGSNPKSTLTYNDIFSQDGNNQLKKKFGQKVAEAISLVMTEKNISFKFVQNYLSEVTDKMNDILDEEWGSRYGITVEDVSISISATDECMARIAEQDAKISETRRMGEVYGQNLTGTMAAATGEAMKEAAGNENGALNGFIGYGVAQNAGSSVLGTVLTNQNNNAQAGQNAAPTSEGVNYCSNCGKPASGNFCSHCGKKLK